MSGFDVGELLPFYLDETDEQINALNDALLKLEQDPADGPVLREAFRMVHSIKGSATVMGFHQVKNLAHHLETFFDQLRAGERTLDRPTLDLCFRCLDGLRDYHRELRQGRGDAVDLTALTDQVLAALEGKSEAPTALPPEAVERAAPVTESTPTTEPEAAPEEPAPSIPVPLPSRELAAEEAAPTAVAGPVEPGSSIVRVTVHFQPGLPWADMKAKLVLNRLLGRSRLVTSEPTVEALERVDHLASFSVWVVPDCDNATLRSLADVEGVERIEVQAEAASTAEPTPDVEPVPAAVAAAPSDQPPHADTPAEPLDPAPAAEPQPETARAPAKKVADTLRVEVDRLDHLMNLAGELVINRSRFLEISTGLEELFADSSASFLTEDTQERLDNLSHDLELMTEPLARAGGGLSGNTASAFDRWVVQFRRLRENFVAIQEELAALRRGRDQIHSLSDAIHQLARVTDGIQKGVLETRMVPIGPLFDRFQRVIRDLRHSSNKEITLRIQGEKTELDKRMIDELADPLIHMVRNSVDHGLELPDDRVRKGKPRSGTVRLNAAHRGNSVVIEVSDDGRGIDCERVRQKVVEKGLMTAEAARKLTERQVINFIWHPGLSTAQAVTDISGRGVGMDIVKSRIENLNGSVDLRTEPGRGTTFTIRLPLTLAILPCLLVQILEEVYAIPLDHIEEIVEVEPHALFRVRDKRMIEIRKRLVPVVALEDVLTWGGRTHPAARNREADSGKRTIVVAHNGETVVGLLVDQLIGMHEIVLKSLERNFRPVPNLSGASILGDGRVSLILDIDALINTIIRRADRQVG